jgi:hypothetical protein
MYTNAACDGTTAVPPACLKILASSVGIRTDSTPGTQGTTWSEGTSSIQNTSLDQNYSFENDLSVTGSAGISGVASAQFGFGLNVNGSSGLSTLTKNTTTLDESTGIVISSPGTFATPTNYQYTINPYIMGTNQQGGVVDNQSLPADVKTFGLIRAMFTADPLTTDSGKWWKQVYTQAPDVALNHPSRWDILPAGQGGSNCLPKSGAVNSGMDCAVLNVRSPDNPGLSAFHMMRGFFISSALSQGPSPQLEQAKAGDKLTLQARVYNYSLAAMPDGSKVHVRFYFMPWNVTTNTPAGDSVLINEEEANPIPPFNDTTIVPNWIMVPTTFDTSQFDQTKHGNVSLLFWVVVWMQTPGPDGNPVLVQEMPGHGLTANGTLSTPPGTLTSLAQAAALEDDYSNNVGIFEQIFYIASPFSAPPGPPQSGSVSIGKLDLSTDRVMKGGQVVLSAMLTDSVAATSANVNFYDGDPQHGGQLFAVQRIPFIDEQRPHRVQVVFKARTCGVHQFFAVVNPGSPAEEERRAHPVRVECSSTERQ